MRVEIRSSFARDTKKLPNLVKENIADAIALIMTANTFTDIPNVKDIKVVKKLKMPIECELVLLGFVFSTEIQSLN